MKYGFTLPGRGLLATPERLGIWVEFFVGKD